MADKASDVSVIMVTYNHELTISKDINGAVIGAGSVVVRDVPKETIVFGIPAIKL